RRRSVPGILPALVRHAQGAARRLLGHARPAAPQHLAQLLHARPARRLGGLPHLRPARMKILLVTPVPAGSRQGNRITALRWVKLLRGLGHRVTIDTDYRGREVDLLIALHARKSHAAITRFRAAHPERPLILCLTGTDVYADIHTS